MEEVRKGKEAEPLERLGQGGISRRQFIKTATALGASVAAAEALASCQPAPAPAATAVPPAPTAVPVAAPTTAPAAAPTAAPAAPTAMPGMMLLFNPYLCTGCLQCATACAEKWQAELFPNITDNVNLEFSRIRPMRFQYVDVLNVCNQCTLVDWGEGTNDAPCMSVCPQKAISFVPKGQGKEGFTGNGYKTIDRSLCLGLDACGRCLEICEQGFGSGISFDPVEKKAQVCTMCGGDPACAKVCYETGALQVMPLMQNGRNYAHQPEAYAELLYMKMFNVRREL